MHALIPLRDDAALATFADEAAALRFSRAAAEARQSFVIDIVQAYTSVAVFFDADSVRFDAVAKWLREVQGQAAPRNVLPGKPHAIPCCYEGPDLARVADALGLAAEEVIRWHAGTTYTVHAIGFCPGFPYLGYLPPELSGVPRLESPRLRVEAGSVGMTGRQTGIYTEERPGGWNLIGQTPLTLVDVRDGYFPLRVGDRVRFTAIDAREFQARQGQRLECF